MLDWNRTIYSFSVKDPVVRYGFYSEHGDFSINIMDDRGEKFKKEVSIFCSGDLQVREYTDETDEKELKLFAENVLLKIQGGGTQ